MLVEFLRESIFANNLELWQSMPLSKSENKLIEITRDPYFEDIEWKYCILEAVQMGEGEEGEKFF